MPVPPTRDDLAAVRLARLSPWHAETLVCRVSSSKQACAPRAKIHDPKLAATEVQNELTGGWCAAIHSNITYEASSNSNAKQSARCRF